MINNYYLQELSNLRELAAEFSKAYPALSPMLSGPTRDPDVERLLEGTAFLTGLLRSKLQDEFPEFIHGLMHLAFPHILRPMPSATIMVFTPKASLKEPLLVPAGTAVASIPVDGTKCVFRTSSDVEVLPLRITDASLRERTAVAATIRIGFQLLGLSLKTWRPRTLRLHLSGPYADATTVFLHLLRRTRAITVRPLAGGSPLSLPLSAVKAGGFGVREGLYPYPRQSFPGYRILQEYFVLPEKFLFLDITGLETWSDPGGGDRFEIAFDIETSPGVLPRVGTESFHLFATPAVNLFEHDAIPIRLDHRGHEYRVQPEGTPMGHYQVYSVEKVTGIAQGTVRTRDYQPLEGTTHQAGTVPVYYMKRRIAPVQGSTEVRLEFSFPPGEPLPENETLAASLLCTNSRLPERLRLGDIREPTSTSPELCDFRNIRQPTRQVEPPLEKGVLWRILSHLTINFLPLADAEGLRTLLGLYIPSEGMDRTEIEANKKRVQGIKEMSVKPADRLAGGQVVRGRDIDVVLDPDSFPSSGDMFLFGSVLDWFLGTYASINSFTRLSITDSNKGETFRWPTRAGDKPLL